MYKQYSFPYRPVHGRLSPMVPVRLFHNKSRIRTYAYPDSGAYYSVFHPSEAHDLGIEIKTGKRVRLTMANGQVITVYLHRMGFRLGREHFTATIGFSEELGIVSTCSGDTASSISSCSALMTTSTCFM